MKASTKWLFIIAGWLALAWQAITTMHGGIIASALLVTAIIWHEAQQEYANKAAAERRAKRNAKYKGE